MPATRRCVLHYYLTRTHSNDRVMLEKVTLTQNCEKNGTTSSRVEDCNNEVLNMNLLNIKRQNESFTVTDGGDDFTISEGGKLSSRNYVLPIIMIQQL